MSDGITPLTPQQLEQNEQETLKDSYIHRVLVAFDILINVICGGNPDETISSRASRAATEGKTWGIILSKFLDVFQSDHGAKAQAGDVERAIAVENLEDKSGNL
jgi:hypothetical protein